MIGVNDLARLFDVNVYHTLRGAVLVQCVESKPPPGNWGTNEKKKRVAPYRIDGEAARYARALGPTGPCG